MFEISQDGGKSTAAYKKTAEKVMVKTKSGKMVARCVYVGKKGGKYIMKNKKFVPVKKA